MYNKKGQAAMEFLMTYGWAILAAIIAIGVLAYFGVFSPGKYAPSATVVNPPLYAQGAVVDSATNSVQVELKNNGGEDITVTSFLVAGCTANTATISIPVGASNITISPACTGITAGKSFKGDITIRYTKSGSTLALVSSGSLTQIAI